MGMEGNFPLRWGSGTGMEKSLGSEMGKQSPYIPYPVYIPYTYTTTKVVKLLLLCLMLQRIEYYICRRMLNSVAKNRILYWS
jgi:hypothetical protein